MIKKTRRSAAVLLSDNPAVPHPVDDAPVEAPRDNWRYTQTMYAEVILLDGKLTLDANNHLGDNPLQAAGFKVGDRIWLVLAARNER